jgi:serine protease Do
MSEFNQENQSIYNNYQQPQPGSKAPITPAINATIIVLNHGNLGFPG